MRKMTVKDINELSKEDLAQQYMRMQSMLDEQTKSVHQLQERNNQLKSNKEEFKVNRKDIEPKLQIAQEQIKN